MHLKQRAVKRQLSKPDCLETSAKPDGERTAVEVSLCVLVNKVRLKVSHTGPGGGGARL